MEGKATRFYAVPRFGESANRCGVPYLGSNVAGRVHRAGPVGSPWLHDAMSVESLPASDTGPVGTAVIGGVCTIILRRPPVNALDEDLVSGLGAAFAAVWADPDVRAIVVAGDGPCFCAGADIEMLQRLDAGAFSGFVEGIQGLLSRVERSPKPVVAAIDGPAMGGGLELALACDLQILGGHAKLGVPEVRLGLLPGAGGTQRLARALPKGHALDLLLSGRTVDAEDAFRMGLGQRLVPAGGALAEAQEMARTLAGGAPLAMAAIKECVLSGREASLEGGLALERETARRLGRTKDFAEGLAAFLDKRSPRFLGL